MVVWIPSSTTPLYNTYKTVTKNSLTSHYATYHRVKFFYQTSAGQEHYVSWWQDASVSQASTRHLSCCPKQKFKITPMQVNIYILVLP